MALREVKRVSDTGHITFGGTFVIVPLCSKRENVFSLFGRKIINITTHLYGMVFACVRIFTSFLLTLGITHKVHLDKETLKKPGLCDNPNKTQILCITFWTSFLVFLYDGMQVKSFLYMFHLLLISVSGRNVG